MDSWTPPLSAALTGSASGLTLIVALGAQNACVLRQGLRREHVGPIVLLCTAADALIGASMLALASSLAVQGFRHQL